MFSKTVLLRNVLDSICGNLSEICPMTKYAIYHIGTQFAWFSIKQKGLTTYAIYLHMHYTRNKRLFILSRGRGVLLEFYPGWRKERQCSSHEGSPRTLAALLSGTSRILPWRARLNCQAPQNRERMGCRTGPTERDDAKAAWNHASLPFGGSSTWVLNVVGEIVPSLIRLGTIVSYHFKIQTIVDGHCLVM